MDGQTDRQGDSFIPRPPTTTTTTIIQQQQQKTQQNNCHCGV